MLITTDKYTEIQKLLRKSDSWKLVKNEGFTLLYYNFKL